MTGWTSVLAVTVGFFAAATTARAQSVTTDVNATLTIFVYDRHDRRWYESLVELARPIFDRAQIPTQWIDTTRADFKNEALVPYRKIAIRIMRSTRPDRRSSGHALPGGVIGSVYPEALMKAAPFGTNPALLERLIAYAATHEIGHLLGRAHQKTGIMRPRWTKEEITGSTLEHCRSSIVDEPTNPDEPDEP